MRNHKRVSLPFLPLSIVSLFCLLPMQTADSTQESPTRIECVAWSPDGSQFATGQNDGTVQIWDTATNQLLRAFHVTAEPDPSLIISDVKWSPDGNKLAVAATSGWSYAVIPVLDATTGQILATFEAYTESYEVDWSPDGSKLAGAAIKGHAGSSFSSGVIEIWDTDTWQELVSLDESSAISSVAWSPDGAKLASGDADGVTVVRSVSDWQWLYYLLASTSGSASDITWSPDGVLLAVTSGRGPIRVWSTSTQQVSRTFECRDNGSLLDMTWNPDGSQIAAACTEGIRIWEVASGLLIDIIHTDVSPRAVDWSPDGRKLLYSTTSLMGANIVELFASPEPTDPRDPASAPSVPPTAPAP
jgi:WD40 repeat protein